MAGKMLGRQRARTGGLRKVRIQKKNQNKKNPVQKKNPERRENHISQCSNCHDNFVVVIAFGGIVVNRLICTQVWKRC